MHVLFWAVWANKLILKFVFVDGLQFNVMHYFIQKNIRGFFGH